jgi:hypothetical protein
MQPLHHGGDAGLGNFQLCGDIDHPGIALGFDQLADSLKVVFNR